MDQANTRALLMLVKGIVELEDEPSAYAFLDDLCTPRELEDLSQRLQVARMLHAGESYATIQAATGASATTVARVARCVKYGSGGYHAVLQMLPRFSPDELEDLPGEGSGD